MAVRHAPSTKPIARKLGVKDGHRVRLINADEAMRETLSIPEGATVIDQGPANVVVLFANNRIDVEELGESAVEAAAAGILWIAYPKTRAKGGTDLDRDILAGAAAQLGFEAVSNVAIDRTWSALRFRANDARGDR